MQREERVCTCIGRPQHQIACLYSGIYVKYLLSPSLELRMHEGTDPYIALSSVGSILPQKTDVVLWRPMSRQVIWI